MATINSVQGKQDQLEEEEDEEEALSLCDLPITLINRKDHQDQLTEQDSPHINEEFDFRSRGSALFSKEPEMCAADDVFFQGQILPLRFPFSSESGSITKRDYYGNNNQVNHDSECSDQFQSNSSRSSSVRSQNSPSSSSSSSTTSSTSTNTTTTPTRISKPRIIRNQFHTHPSPKPQLRRISGPRQTSTLSSNQGRKSSSAWEFFRLGVVPAPEIKLRSSNSNSNRANKNCVSRNSSSSSTSSNGIKKSVKIMSKKSTHHDGDKNNNNHHVFKQLMMGCKCSAETVVGSDIVMIKSGTKSTKKKESTQHAVKEEEKGVVAELTKPKHRSQKQGKKVMSHCRTFEWLKELHACHDPDDEEALLSNP